jgi:hypothetical protein
MYLNKYTDMKKIHMMKKLMMLTGMLVLIIASCRKDNNGKFPGRGAPVVSYIRTVAKSDSLGPITITTYDSSGVASTTSRGQGTTIISADSTTASGKLNNTYAIIGKNLGSTTSIVMNGVIIYFNRALSSDNTLVFTIPSNVPFGPTEPNTIIITTLYGKVTYPFTIVTPPPVLTTISPLAGSAGDTVTITGSDLANVSSVKFGTVPSSIVPNSNTATEVKVIIPAGVVQAYVYVTTPGGTTKSSQSFGFKLIVYESGLSLYWGGNQGGYSGFNSTLNFTDTQHPVTGTEDISVIYQNPYGALQIGYGGTTISVASNNLLSIKFSVYGGAGIKTGDRIQVVINGSYGTAVLETLTPGAYSTYTIPLSQLGNPTTISEIVLQGYGVAVPSTIYVADIGFI